MQTEISLDKIKQLISEISNKIKDDIKKGYTRTEIYTNANLCFHTLKKLEMGKSENIHYEALSKLLSYYEKKRNYLFCINELMLKTFFSQLVDYVNSAKEEKGVRINDVIHKVFRTSCGVFYEIMDRKYPIRISLKTFIRFVSIVEKYPNLSKSEVKILAAETF